MKSDIPRTPFHSNSSGLSRQTLCVAISAGSIDELIAKSRELRGSFPFQELRLDYLPDPLAAVSALPDLLTGAAPPALLATCRRTGSGGRFRGDAGAELDVLAAAAKAGCVLVDLALESAEELGRDALGRLRNAGAAVVLSFHDFEGPNDVEAVYRRMTALSPDLCKIVPTAHGLRDNLGLLHFLQTRQASDPQVVGLLMGEAGMPSRILGVRAGSAFTFGAASAAEATASGQIDALTLRDLYRLETLNADTKLYGVAGDPVASSRSPLMLNAAFGHAGQNAVYLPLLTHDAADLFRFARDLPLAGFSVTMPLKAAVLPHLDQVDPLARKIGAVNTVVREPDGSYSGYNTDIAGITGPLEERLSLGGARVLVLGAGGAARAAAFGCADRGASVAILNRTFANAVQLADEAGGTALQHDELAGCPAFDVVINATPAGMRGNATALPIDTAELRTRLVFDTVYNPLETPLIQAARARGVETIAGIEMFVRQGARQFELWTGEPAPVDLMRDIVLKSLTGATRS